MVIHDIADDATAAPHYAILSRNHVPVNGEGSIHPQYILRTGTLLITPRISAATRLYPARVTATWVRV